jgi:hypothetical protein
MVSTAFKSGVYDVKKLPTFGNGDYGNLEATVAAILLDREAVSFALDADPSVGSLREVSHDINHIVILLLPSSIAHIFGLRQYRDYRESPLLNSFPS